MSATVERKLVDLRVVELKNELDKRGLDKTGVKALLISRLQEALRGEGSDPETHVFKVVDQSQKKSSKKLREDTEKDTGEEEEEEVVMEAAECFGEIPDEAEVQVAKSDEELLSVPSPEAVEPKCPFSVEDTICLHDSNSANFEQSESLIVHTGPSNEADRMDTLTTDISCEGNILDGRREEDEADDADVAEQPEHPLDERNVEMNESSCEVECTVAEADSQAEERFGDENKASTQDQQKDEFQEEEAPSNSSKNSSDYSGTSLWVTGISPSVRAADIKALFSKHGRVQLAKIVTCAKLPGSKCYGFITMVTPEEATKCIEVLNHSELGGKTITVERAKSDQLVTQKGQTGGSKKTAPAAATGAAMPAASTTTTTGTSATATATTTTTAAPSKKSTSASGTTGSAEATTNPAQAGAEAGESSGKEKKDEAAARARSKEKPRSSPRQRDERHRKRSRSRSRSRSTRRRHYYDGDDYNRSYRGRATMGRMLRRPMGGRSPFARRMMRSSYPPRYMGMSSRYYEDRHSRESEYERMKMREKEYIQREEMLRIEREKARLRADRERLEREKLELQQQRMRLSYESGGAPGSVPGSGAGMKRMYDGGSPYTPKRVSYPGPGGYDTRIGVPRDRPSGSYRRPDYGDARDVRRSGGPPERYDYRGDRSGFGGGARSSSGDHRSAPRLTSMSSAGANGSSRTDARRMSPPSSMSRRGRPSTSWNNSGRSGNFGAHGSGGSPWSESVGGGGQGSGWGRSGPSASTGAWGSGCFSGGGGGNSSDQYGGGGDRFDSYGKYSGSVGRRY